MKKIKSIHFVGIKGVGTTPLAIIAKEAGITVTGSDIAEEFITDEGLKRAGIKVFEGFEAAHVDDVDLVIASGAHGGRDNDEVKSALSRGIKVLMQGQAVGAFMDGSILGKHFEGISVAGAHGKTTTTAMIATILKDAGLDPTYVIGTGNVSTLGSSGHLGRGKYFVAEADEYMTDPKYDKTVKFLWQHPKIAVITNIEFDHPDVYSSIDDMREAFLKFANSLGENEVLIANGDDKQTSLLLEEYKGRVITFGLSPRNDFYLQRISLSGERTFFRVNGRGMNFGEFSIGVAGEHNAVNALASIVVANELGIDIEKVKKATAKFTGSKRRAEYIGKLPSGAMLFDDYAHHPTEIKKTLKAFRKTFPKARIVCIFQPHTYSRTKSLFEEFKTSFIDANTVILTNIYASLREIADPAVSSALLAQEVALSHNDVLFLPTLTNVVEYLDKIRYDSNAIVITMGAGDVYKIAESLDIRN